MEDISNAKIKAEMEAITKKIDLIMNKIQTLEPIADRPSDAQSGENRREGKDGQSEQAT